MRKMQYVQGRTDMFGRWRHLSLGWFQKTEQ